MSFTPGAPKPANSGRRKGQRNRRTVEAAIARTDALKFLSDILDSDDETITRDQKIKCACALAQYQHPKPVAAKSETFIGLADYVAPTTAAEARAMVLSLGARLSRKEVSVEAHEALVSGLKVFLGDNAVALESQVAELEDLIRFGPAPTEGERAN